ncbi:microtubule-associated protein 4 isoform X2 [Osmerus eperlanus]|uniref:microtubule-associated protein 4 isoform X2 n=1 Tax=Osmerus eperlanus TaxID=29151 RepID=UPI002E12ED87
MFIIMFMRHTMKSAMSPLICFSNKLVETGAEFHSGSALTLVGAEAADNSTTEERMGFMSLAASCSLDTGKEEAINSVGVHAWESERSHTLWASEDMSYGSARLRDAPASRSPEWAHAVDSQRAVSLDTSECISVTSDLPGTSLMRSMALEDLTAIGTSTSWTDGERISNEPVDPGSLGACNRVTQQIIPESPDSFSAHSLLCSSLDPGTSLPLAGNSAHLSDRQEPSSLFLKDNNIIGISTVLEVLEVPFTENMLKDKYLALVTSDTKRASHISLADVDDCTKISKIIPHSEASEFQRTSQSSPARKSLVPVAIFKAQAKIDNDSAEKKPCKTPTKARPTSALKRPSPINRTPKTQASTTNGPSSLPTKAISTGTRKSRTPGGTRPQAPGTKIPAKTPAQPAPSAKKPASKNDKDTSGHSSPGTPKSPNSQALPGKPLAVPANQVKKVAVVRSTPKSPGSLKNRPPAPLAAAAPMPDLKNIRSKIGSTDNMKHQPGGGRVQILEQKIDLSNVQSKCGSKDNMKHVPGGGNVQILDRKVDVSNVQARCGSKDNMRHTPGGGRVQILEKKLDLSNVQSRCGSKDNMKHVPGGGNVQIVHKKIDLGTVQSKCGSKDNIRHKPGGGNIEIKSEKLDFKVQSKIGSLDNIGHVAGGGQRRREKGKEAEGGSNDSPTNGDMFGLSPADTPPQSPQPLPSAPITPVLMNPLIKIEDSY